MLPLTLSATLEGLAPWLALIGFGAFHGLNPAMGWLFALALGLQQQSERAILVSVLPISLGHAASIGLVALLLFVLGAIFPLQLLQVATAGALLLFGLYKLFRYYRHPRWVGMRVGARDLFVWSFLMATAHGAGLMLAPVLLGITGAPALFVDHHAVAAPLLADAATPVTWLWAIGVHTAAMLLAMVGVAWVVYRKAGLAVLRRNWVNFDLIWAGALLVAGALLLVLSLAPDALHSV